MVEFHRAIEFRHDRGQLDPEAPLVGAASHLLDRRAPPVPPPRDKAGDRLDDEETITGGGAIEEALHERVAGRIGQLVQRKGGEHRQWAFRQRDRCDVAFHRASRQPEGAIRPRCFAERPRMTIDSKNTWRMHARGRPRRAGRARAATEIDKRGGLGDAQRVGERLNNGAHRQKVQRAVEQRKGSALPCPVERAAFTETLPALDIRRRQRTEPGRHLRKGQIPQVMLLGLLQPAIESIVP